MDLNIIWFLLIGVLIGGYAVLDGFDLGVGILYPFLSKNQEDKRVLLNAVGPFWDGNEVWLLTGAGALFAAFPMVYASVFSGFYLAMMLVLFALIVRVAAIEFRNYAESPKWRSRMDLLFFLGSSLPALLFGVAMGNIARGVPLNGSHVYTGGFWALLNPYALLLGVLGLSAFLLQGSGYILLKTEGDLHKRTGKLLPWVWLAAVILYLAATLYTYVSVPALFANYRLHAWMYAAPLLTVAGLVLIPLMLKAKRFGFLFVASSLNLAGLIATLGLGMFPNLLPASLPEYSLTIYNAASSALTLKAMLIIALIGVPIVLFYTIYVYRVFSGKVDMNSPGY